MTAKIGFAGRSYKVGDLMRALPAKVHYLACEVGSLVLIIKAAGHPRYFYGLHCASGKEELLSLENYVGVHECGYLCDGEKNF